jgi:hypothetical protein
MASPTSRAVVVTSALPHVLPLMAAAFAFAENCGKEPSNFPPFLCSDVHDGHRRKERERLSVILPAPHRPLDELEKVVYENYPPRTQRGWNPLAVSARLYMRTSMMSKSRPLAESNGGVLRLGWRRGSCDGC